MIEMSTVARVMQESPHGTVRYCRVESWLGAELLSDDVPIASGREECDRTSRIPERVTLRVPRQYRGQSWIPDAATDHPLAANGQRLRVLLGIGKEGNEIEWIQRGEFLINSSEPQGDSVNVEAVGLMALIDEARFVAPLQPSGTLKKLLRALIEPAVTVVFHPDLTDRSVPSGINYDEDRLGAVLELLDAWPAVPPTVSSVSSYNLIESTRATSREGAFNCVVARGTAADGAPIQGVAYVTSGPLTYLGKFNPLPVPRYFASPLLTTLAACRASALTIRNRVLREQQKPYVVKTLPLMFVQIGDRVILTDEDDRSTGAASVEALSLPYTPGDGAMSMTLVAE
jgi:hypothetical protein